MEEHSEGLYEMEDFHRKEGVAEALLAKEKNGLFLDQGIFCVWGSGRCAMGRGREGKDFIMQTVSSCFGDGEGTPNRLPHLCLPENFRLN